MVEPERKVSISAESMPLIYFCRWLSDAAGVSIVAEQRLDESPVSVDVIDVPVSQLLGVVSRRLNVQLTRTGDLYFLGTLRPEDRGVLVRKVSRLSGEELEASVSVLLSDNGRVEAFSDGLVLVGDSVEVLTRVNELLDGVESAAIDTWVVQLYVVSLTTAAERELGLDVVPAVELGVTFAKGSGGANDAYQHLLTGSLDGILRATATTTGAAILADPTFLLVDGGSSNVNRIERFPIQQTVFDDDGNARSTDTEFIDIGMKHHVTIRDVGSGRAMLSAGVELSTISGFVGDLPRQQSETFQTTAVVESGGVYLLGGMNRDETTETISGPLQLLVDKGQQLGKLQVWARAYRVAAPANPPQPKATRTQDVAFPDYAIEDVDLAREFARRDGRDGDEGYIGWLLRNRKTVGSGGTGRFE